MPSAINESVIIDSSSRDADEGVGDFYNLDGRVVRYLMSKEFKRPMPRPLNGWRWEGLIALILRIIVSRKKGGTVRYYTRNDKLILIEHVYGEYDHYEAVDRY